MTLSKDEVLDAVAQMSVMEVVELVKAMEDKFGVSAAAAPVAAAPAAGAEAEAAAAEEQTEFKVALAEIGDKKIEVIKVVRALTGKSLKEAKELVDNAPSVIAEAAAKNDAEEMQKKLSEAGAKVELQ